MIGLELKQKAEEHSENWVGRGEKENGESRRRSVIVWEGKEWAIASAAVLQLVSGLFLIRMSGGPFPLACFCQQSA